MPTKAALARFAQLAVMAWAGASVAIAAASWLAVVVRPLDLLNQIAPFWLLLSLLGSVGVLLFPGDRERARLRVAFAVAIAAQSALIVPELVRPTPPAASAAADAPRVRIVWLNTQSGSAPAGLTEYLATSDADFLLLSEYHAYGGAVPNELAAVFPHFTSCFEPHDCNVVIMSRRTPVASHDAQMGNTSALRVTWAAFSIDGAPLRLIATHLNRPYPASRHAAQRAELAELIASSAANTILAGDLNATPWSFALRNFDRASNLTRHDHAMPTWPAAAWTRLRFPAPEAFMPLDHVYSGDNWRLVSIRRGPRTGADHYPIEAEFVWTGDR